ncbi:11018_t:CDS:2 [Gigaspora margarita]|uniref:11018_t:CDS:1 n=1 Tax=Gigaspora margarita TaxID=4874 RepID=A0ABN7UEV1_GIGMA|nr:11018_t:CDS:2 [Gigaspora margarita]
MSNKPREPVSDIDPQIKTYINSANQTIITTLLGRAETQRHRNKQLQKAIEKCFSKLEQASLSVNETSISNRITNKEAQNEQKTLATICLQLVIDEEIPQGNYLSIPILNNIIIDLVLLEASVSKKVNCQ